MLSSPGGAGERTCDGAAEEALSQSTTSLVSAYVQALSAEESPASAPRIRAAVVGTGAIVTDSHLPALRAHADRVELVSAVDIDPDRVKLFREAADEAAARLVAPRAATWQECWRTGALAAAQRTGDHLRALAAADPAHLAEAQVAATGPSLRDGYGMCGRRDEYALEGATLPYGYWTSKSGVASPPSGG
jgi:hypothetical protein